MIESHQIIAKNGYATNTFLLKSENTVVIIDPGAAAEEYTEHIAQGDNVILLLTHGHHDHIGSCNELRQNGARLLMSKADADLFNITADEFVTDEQKLCFGEIKLTVVATPGHTPGSVCYYDKSTEKLYAGDTLFYRECGRCDLIGGDFSAMLSSLKKLTQTISEKATVFPGHGRATDMGGEMLNNQYIKQAME